MIFSFFTQLYCEVRAKREGTSRKQNLDVTNQLNIHSTGSSSPSGNSPSEPSSGSSRSGTARITSLPGFSQARNVGAGDGGGHPTCFQEDHLSQYINAGGQKEHSHQELIELSSLEPWQQLSVTETTDLGDISHAAPGYGMDLTIGSSNSGETDSDGVSQSSPRSEPSYGNEKKGNTTALNAVSVRCTINQQQTSLSVLYLFLLKDSWLQYTKLVWDLAILTYLSPSVCVSGSERNCPCKQGALQLPG